MPIIFRKTPKGVAEIETRANRLPQRLRSTLILVDGRRDTDDFRQLMAQPADDALQALAEQGFVEAVGETVGVAESLAAYAPMPPPRPAPDLATVRRLLARALQDELGASAKPLAKRIVGTRNVEELKPLLNLAVQLVVAARGRTAADVFATRLPLL